MTTFWTHNSGLVCAVHPGPLGSLNGYVAVPESHPWHGVGYSEHLSIECAENESEDGYCWSHSPEAFIDVHGGITYSGAAAFLGTEAGWWFGFDTAHAGDLVPGLADLGAPQDGATRGEDYVRAQCEHMAVQLAAVAVASR